MHFRSHVALIYALYFLHSPIRFAPGPQAILPKPNFVSSTFPSITKTQTREVFKIHSLPLQLHIYKDDITFQRLFYFFASFATKWKSKQHLVSLLPRLLFRALKFLLSYPHS